MFDFPATRHPADAARGEGVLSRGADYAVRAAVHLATFEPGARRAQQEIAAAIAVPFTFTGKTLQRLVASGLVDSKRGKHGGFSLTDKGRQGSMYDVLVAIDGPPALNECMWPSTRCPLAPFCAAHRVWGVAQAQVVGILKAALIETLAADAARLAAAQSSASAATHQQPQEHVIWATR